jgi:hypothetical protein
VLILGSPFTGAASATDSLTDRASDHGEHSLGQADLDYAGLPGRLSDESQREHWRKGVEFELLERLLESSVHYEVIVSRVPEESYTYWRLARNYWRHGESLPTDEKQLRLHYFELAEEWSARGIAIDPDCGPCMLWKFVAMGRQATTNGILSAAGDVREMDALLRRGIELQPQHRDGGGNTTLGNLYYAGAVFYRVVPDWFWARWFLGVRGDKERSVEFARRAVEISQSRVDYRIELGAALLCVGTAKSRPENVAEGMRVLREARELPDYLSTDRLDKAHALVLAEAPHTACGFSRDGFIDIDEVVEESRARR